MKKTERTKITIDFYHDSSFINFGEPGMQEVDLDLICHSNFITKNREEAQLFCLLVFDFATQAENPIL